MSSTVPIAVLISGRGSNLQALIEASRGPTAPYEVVLVLSDQPAAAGLGVARDLGIAARALPVDRATPRADYDRALPLLDAGLGQRQARPTSGRAVGAAYTLACKGCVLGDRGRFAEAEEYFSEALQLIGGARHQIASAVRHWRCLVLQWQGRWEEALRMADDSAEIAEHTRCRHQMLVGRSMASYVRWVLKQRREDLQTLRDATAWIEARNGRLAMSLNHSWMVEAALATGNQAEARHYAARLFMRTRQADRLGEALGCRALARNAAGLGQLARAEHYLASAERAATARGSAHEHASNQLCEAEIRLAVGQAAQARALLDKAMNAFHSMSMAWHLDRARAALRPAESPAPR